MEQSSKSFGQVIAERRKALYMTQRDLASQVRREDGAAISGAYLNDIEHDRRSPSPELLKQFAAALTIPEDYLTYLAGRFPCDHELRGLSQATFIEGMRAFRHAARRS